MTCRDCAREDMRVVGRGLCGGCYDRHWQAKTLDLFPRLSREPRPIPTEKPCPICKVTLPLEDFAQNNRRPDGRGSYCKPCARTKYHAPARQRMRSVPKPSMSVEQVCVDCCETKSTADFYWQADKGRFSTQCKRCKKLQDKAYRDGNPREYRSKVLKRKYGITVAEFDEMLAAQSGGCAICTSNVNPDGPSLAVDHCHKTGKVRGILCGPCNKAIGLFRDDVLLLEKAVTYLG